MSSFDKFAKRVNVLGSRISTEIKTCPCFEDAAQKFAELMYQSFSNSIVLTRLFVTVPFGSLPNFNQNFVTELANSAGVRSLLRDNTPVLSLMGTCGQNPIWNSWRNSQGHLGIPLVSENFIASIPMMSRLLKELGLSLEWLDGYGTNIVTRKMGRLSGLFYVQDAATELDDKNRKIISAQDFVRTYNIKTVFGMGGGYPVRGRYSIMISFTNKNLPHRGAEKFMTFINIFNAETAKLVLGGKIFR